MKNSIFTSAEKNKERRIGEVNRDAQKRRQALELEAQLDKIFEDEMEVYETFPEELKIRNQLDKKNPNRGYFNEEDMRAMYYGGREDWQPGCRVRRITVLPRANRCFLINN